jgi:peptidoglycan pentaglycine glycine transferase (the first glycine)
MEAAEPLRLFRITDANAWNRFVEATPYHAFPQLWEWGELRRGHGWEAVRVAVGPSPEAPLAGAQLLLRSLPLLGWRLGYAPRGPIGQLDDARIRGALVKALRAIGRVQRIATIRADPETTAEDPYGGALASEPWRAAAKVQPPLTRIIDLRIGEEALRAQMKRKHRQYVAKAERAGVEVERLGGWAGASEAGAANSLAAVADFNRIYASTAERAGFAARAPEYYQRVWRLFAPTGRCRLSFARLGGERVASLFHFTCGDRVVEAYGGMTDTGAESRANYLLKWRAIADFAAEGFAVYDLWGLATGGIRHFKEGFGGHDVEYVGAVDLPLRAPVDALLRGLIPAYGWAQRARLRLLGRRLSAPPQAGDD